ncbi:MAG: hypothetical protein WCB58_20180 [Acidobacteriaceae bacterium]
MPLIPKSILPVLLFCALCLATTRTASADVGNVGDAKATGVIFAIVGVGALIGVGIYYAVHHGHSLRGCASSRPDGIQILNESDQKTYLLGGNVNEVKPGDRVRVSGDKQKNGGSGRQFFVKKLSKNYGLCRVSASTP